MSLPTIEQVAEHAEVNPVPGGGGLWRLVRFDEPYLVVLLPDGATIRCFTKHRFDLRDAALDRLEKAAGL
jgi:hypothetical protein